MPIKKGMEIAVKKIFKDFNEFAFKGNVIDLAVGVIIGGAFGKIVTSIVNDLIMPLIGIFTGSMNFTNLFIVLGNNAKYEELISKNPTPSLAEVLTTGAPIFAYGNFLTIFIDFLIMAFVIFIMIRYLNKLRKRNAPAPVITTKVCQYCKSSISVEATRCPFCTSELEANDVH